MTEFNYEITEAEQAGQRIDKLLPNLIRIGLEVKFKIGSKKIW